jgi:hypothetical protein
MEHSLDHGRGLVELSQLALQPPSKSDPFSSYVTQPFQSLLHGKRKKKLCCHILFFFWEIKEEILRSKEREVWCEISKDEMKRGTMRYIQL